MACSNPSLLPFSMPSAAEPAVIVRGEGVYVYDEHGHKYFEGVSGLWCVGLGFSDTSVIDAMHRQLRTLPYYHNFMGRASRPHLDLAARLVAVAPPGFNHVTFGSSGSEAVDTAAKLVWYYFNARQQPAKKKLISRDGAYHGSGILSGSLTGMSSLHAGFDLPVTGVLHTGSPHYARCHEPGESEIAFSRRRARELDALIRREDPATVAAMFAEPIIGSGGVILPPEGYWSEIQAVLERHGVLLVADEIICGFGRTGRMFGTETYDLRPAMMVVAKQLTSAYAPLSAVLLRDDVYDVVAQRADAAGGFGHGFTYAGHPLAAAAAIATLDRYEELDLLRHVGAVSPILADTMADLAGAPGVLEARSVGLIAAVEFRNDESLAQQLGVTTATMAQPVVAAAQRRGAIFRPLGNIVGICPPLVITSDELRTLCSILRDSIHEVFGGHG